MEGLEAHGAAAENEVLLDLRWWARHGHLAVNLWFQGDQSFVCCMRQIQSFTAFDLVVKAIK